MHIDNVGDGLEGGILSGAFFQNITSDKVRFVVDSSGSMSACVMWARATANGPARLPTRPGLHQHQPQLRLHADGIAAERARRAARATS